MPSRRVEESPPASVEEAAAWLRIDPAELRELARDEDVATSERDASAVDAFELDRRLRLLVRSLQAVDSRTGRLLDLFAGGNLTGEAGFDSFETYVSERLGISVRKARALISLQRRAADVPALANAYRSGELSWLRAMILLPIVQDEGESTILAWIERARQVTVRRLSDDVAWATEMKAIAAAGESYPDPPPLDASVEALEREVQMRMEGSVASGQPSESAAGANAYVIEVSGPATVIVGLRQAIVAWCEPSEPLWIGLCRSLVHVTREWQRQGKRHRNRILDRDRYRCVVPACSSRRNLEVHHLVFRSAGGGDDAENLVTACAAHHHHCIHEGRLRATGKAPHDVTWELGVRPGRAPLLRLHGDAYLDPVAV